MARESADVKGRRLLTEGRLRVRMAGYAGRWPIVAQVTGDSAEVYTVAWDHDEQKWRCTCPAKQRCSHIVALELVVIKPPLPTGGTLP